MPSFFIIFAVVAVIGVVVSMLRFRAISAAWMVAATELGFDEVPRGRVVTSPRMGGVVDSMAVSVDVYRTGGNNSQTYTRYTVHYPPLGIGLQMRRQTGLTTFAKFFGAQDHEIGDKAFDDAFAIKAKDPASLGVFFTPARREALLRLLAVYSSLEVDDAELRYLSKGLQRDPIVIVSTVRRLAASAAAFTGTRRAPGIDEVVAARAEGNSADAAEQLTAVVRPHPDDIDTRIMEVETLYGAGRAEEAEAVLRDLDRIAPADPEVQGWHDIVERETPEVSGGERTDTDPVAVSEALFAENRLSFETTSLFEDQFAGRRVQWSGTVRRSAISESDRDFDATIAKALIHVATIENDLYGNAEVDAVVAFEPRLVNQIRRGERVTFTGRLFKVDGLVRNLFVADAGLV